MQWKQIPLPALMRELPKDERGYPVTFLTNWENGKPNFRVTDAGRWLMCATQRLCGVCGKALFRWVYFIGGPRSMESRFFHDAPMHRECAEYALQVCPFLAYRNFDYAPLEKATQHTEGPIVALTMAERPDRFGLYRTNGFRWTQDPNGGLLFQADPPQSITWHAAK